MRNLFCDSEVHSDISLWCVVLFLTAWTVQCAIMQNNVLFELQRKFIFTFIGILNTFSCNLKNKFLEENFCEL